MRHPAQQHSAAPTIVVIPSLEPSDQLLTYVRQLRERNLTEVIVVDDGSGPASRAIFDALVDEGCTVLRHETNRGKGSALKTAFAQIAQHHPEAATIVTADSDGQHDPDDVVRVAAESAAHPEALVLGERDLSADGVPPKSLIGNRISAAVFAALYKQKLSDTQTGLRAFGRLLLGTMLAAGGTRFEYEINVLITCARRRVELRTVPIRVIYENSNRGTHFRAFRDSARVIGTIFSSLLRFSASSLTGAVVDLLAAWLLFDLLRPFFAADAHYLRILTASALARILSLAVNYLLNRHLVFRDQKPDSRSLIRYLMLSLLLIVLSASGVFALSTVLGLNEKIAKPICDGVLFFLSYRMQQGWVFKARSPQTPQVGALR